MLVLIFIIGEVFLPMPQYYIKHGAKVTNELGIKNELTLNEILEQETLNAGIEFDDGSFKILDSHGMHFNHLFLCSYEINQKEEVRIFHLEKNIFGNMKPKYPFNGNNIISDKNIGGNFYNSYVKDGIFADYGVIAGFADSSSGISHILNKYIIDQIHPIGYFMWVEMMREPWKEAIVIWVLYLGLFLIIFKFRNKKEEPLKFYSKWEKGDKVFINSKFI
ncbi:MAG: hypothetical protein GX981_01045 [Tissierellia bacterium]|nr:hypothetical protein [Tissierellia bacterium]